jgi:hypothetical protein
MQDGWLRQKIVTSCATWSGVSQFEMSQPLVPASHPQWDHVDKEVTPKEPWTDTVPTKVMNMLPRMVQVREAINGAVKAVAISGTNRHCHFRS